MRTVWTKEFLCRAGSSWTWGRWIAVKLQGATWNHGKFFSPTNMLCVVYAALGTLGYNCFELIHLQHLKTNPLS